MSPNWNHLLNSQSKDLPYSKIIDSYLIHSKYIKLCLLDVKNLYHAPFKININDLGVYLKFKEDAEIIYKYSILFRNGVLKRSKILDIIFFNISNCFVIEKNDSKYLRSFNKNNPFHIALMNLHFGRVKFLTKLRLVTKLGDYKSLFMNNKIKDNNNVESNLNFISEYLNYYKSKKIIPSTLSKLLGESYFNKLESLSKNEYLIHYIAKFNFSIEFFLKIDKMNENFKFKIDNKFRKAYDYFLLHKNNDTLRKLLNMEIDKKLERNYFSNIPLLNLYLRFPHKEDRDQIFEKYIDLDLVVEILKFDNDNFRENIIELMKKEIIMMNFLEKCGSSINIWITRIIFQSYLNNNLCVSFFSNHTLINILYYFFKNNLIPDDIFNNSINNILAYIISNSPRYGRKRVDRIDTIVEIIKIIFNDKRFDKDKYPKLYFERFMETNRTRRTFVFKGHLNKLIKKLYNVERNFITLKKERLIDILLTGPKQKTIVLTKRKRE